MEDKKQKKLETWGSNEGDFAAGGEKLADMPKKCISYKYTGTTAVACGTCLRLV